MSERYKYKSSHLSQHICLVEQAHAIGVHLCPADFEYRFHYRYNQSCTNGVRICVCWYVGGSQIYCICSHEHTDGQQHTKSSRECRTVSGLLITCISIRALMHLKTVFQLFLVPLNCSNHYVFSCKVSKYEVFCFILPTRSHTMTINGIFQSSQLGEWRKLVRLQRDVKVSSSALSIGLNVCFWTLNFPHHVP